MGGKRRKADTKRAFRLKIKKAAEKLPP